MISAEFSAELGQAVHEVERYTTVSWLFEFRSSKEEYYFKCFCKIGSMDGCP